MSKILSFEDFNTHLNDFFQIEQESGKWVTARLVEATELQFKYSDVQGETRASFSLVFHTDFFLSQQMYTFKHDELGVTQIFIVPLSTGTDGNRYEAVFA